MIVNKKVIEYISSLESCNSQLCEDIREEAVKENVPIIKRDAESLLKTVLKIKNPKKILEVGTAVGYSGIVMAESSDAYITTIEKYEPRIEQAKINIKRTNLENRIELLCGDAGEIINELSLQNKKYDFIFMDAAKAQYINWLPVIKKLMNRSGILFSDNILQNGDIALSRFAVSRRDRTIHKRMREYLETISSDGDFTTAILTVGDGIAISVLK